MARAPRDYTAERKARNAAAQKLGFSSLDTLHKARKQGLYPSAKAIRTDKAEARKATRITAKRNRDAAQAMLQRRRPVKLEPIPLSKIKRESQAWSDAHARQDGTKFDASWPAPRQAQFYQAFVQSYMLPNDERQWEDVYDYMEEYPDGFDEIPDRDDDPYRND